MDGYEYKRQRALAELSTHPGFIELCRELDNALQDYQTNLLAADTDENIRNITRVWQGFARAADKVRYAPDRAREYLQQNQQTLGVLEQMTTNEGFEDE